MIDFKDKIFMRFLIAMYCSSVIHNDRDRVILHCIVNSLSK